MRDWTYHRRRNKACIHITATKRALNFTKQTCREHCVSIQLIHMFMYVLKKGELLRRSFEKCFQNLLLLLLLFPFISHCEGVYIECAMYICTFWKCTYRLLYVFDETTWIFFFDRKLPAVEMLYFTHEINFYSHSERFLVIISAFQIFECTQDNVRILNWNIWFTIFFNQFFKTVNKSNFSVRSVTLHGQRVGDIAAYSRKKRPENRFISLKLWHHNTIFLYTIGYFWLVNFKWNIFIYIYYEIQKQNKIYFSANVWYSRECENLNLDEMEKYL